MKRVQKLFLIALSLLPALGWPTNAGASSPLTPARSEILARWLPRFAGEFSNHAPRFQISFACVFEKMIEDHLLVDDLEDVIDLSRGGMLRFSFKQPDAWRFGVRTAQGFFSYLQFRGYTDSFLAARGKEAGLRSPQTGPALHWYVPEGIEGAVDVHIDLYNPGVADWVGDPAITGYRALKHLEVDYEEGAWVRNHTPGRLLAESPQKCGLEAGFAAAWQEVVEF